MKELYGVVFQNLKEVAIKFIRELIFLLYQKKSSE